MMPFFNWNAGPGERILSHRFYIFWAINIPMSVFLCASLSLLIKIREKRREKRLEVRVGSAN